MKFKNITAIFRTVEDIAFIQGKWHKDRSDFKFEVKRHKSGRTDYGDKSAHIVTILNHDEFMPDYFDTRYDGISTEKDKWIDFWRNYIENKFKLVITLDSYNEETVELED